VFVYARFRWIQHPYLKHDQKLIAAFLFCNLD
jgi:hypothetical protein